MCHKPYARAVSGRWPLASETVLLLVSPRGLATAGDQWLLGLLCLFASFLFLGEGKGNALSMTAFTSLAHPLIATAASLLPAVTTNFSWINPRQRLSSRQTFLPTCSARRGLPPTFPVPVSPQAALRGPWSSAGRWQRGESVCQTSASAQTESSSVAGADRFFLPPWKLPWCSRGVVAPSPAGQAAGHTQTLSLPSCNPVLAVTQAAQLSLCASPSSVKISELVSLFPFPSNSYFITLLSLVLRLYPHYLAETNICSYSPCPKRLFDTR